MVDGKTLKHGEFFWISLTQNQCATEVDEEGKVKWSDDKLGTCGAGCPREDDDVWVTDDTLTLAFQYDTDTH